MITGIINSPAVVGKRGQRWHSLCMIWEKCNPVFYPYFVANLRDDSCLWIIPEGLKLRPQNGLRLIRSFHWIWILALLCLWDPQAWRNKVCLCLLDVRVLVYWTLITDNWFCFPLGHTFLLIWLVPEPVWMQWSLHQAAGLSSLQVVFCLVRGLKLDLIPASENIWVPTMPRVIC